MNSKLNYGNPKILTPRLFVHCVFRLLYITVLQACVNLRRYAAATAYTYNMAAVPSMFYILFQFGIVCLYRHYVKGKCQS